MDENDLNQLKNIFSYLVDSFSYEVERDIKAGRIEEITKTLENDKKAIEQMKSKIREEMDQFVTNYKDFGMYEDHIMESINTYAEQFFTRNSHQALSEIADLKSGMEKDVENGTRVMETFLSLNPFTILNSGIKITIDGNSPEIMESINASYGISYAFLLNPEESQFMSNPFFASLYNGIRIPVSENENDVIYESLDGYHMTSGYVNGNKFECSFIRSREQKTFNFKFEKGTSIIAIEFNNSGNLVKITDIPELLRHLDLKILTDAMEKLFNEITDLEKKKKKLVSLKIDDAELLNTMDFGRVFYRIIESSYIKSLVKSLPEKSENPDDLSKEFITQRIHTIGRDQDYIISTLFG
jgi:DNA-binding protein YbaB